MPTSQHNNVLLSSFNHHDQRGTISVNHDCNAEVGGKEELILN